MRQPDSTCVSEDLVDPKILAVLAYRDELVAQCLPLPPHLLHVISPSTNNHPSFFAGVMDHPGSMQGCLGSIRARLFDARNHPNADSIILSCPQSCDTCPFFFNPTSINMPPLLSSPKESACSINLHPPMLKSFGFGSYLGSLWTPTSTLAPTITGI